MATATEPHVGELVEPTALMALTASEINQQIATAKAYPRDIALFRKTATELVTMDDETAGECIYAKPIDGGFVKGPSIRFAEVLVYAFGNLRVGARIVEEGAEFLTTQGVCLDLEVNIAHTADLKRRIVTKKGRRYGPSMIETAAAAACAIARRNAILTCVPKPLWRPIYNAARSKSIGDATTLPDRRKTMIEFFAKMGITPAMILGKLNLSDDQEIGLDQLEILRGLATAIKDGEHIEVVFGTGDVPGGKAGRSPITDDLDAAAELLAESDKKLAEFGNPQEPTREELKEAATAKTNEQEAQLF